MADPIVAKERPIIFSGPMVRAILAGNKTQTRRIVKGAALSWLTESEFTPEFTANPENNLSPYGYAGDRLWVRETWQMNEPPSGAIYRAGDIAGHIDGGWRPSIFMPRWASRLTLEITAVRVERLQEISTADAMEEGIPQTGGEAHAQGLFNLDRTPGHEWDNRTSVENFAVLWDTINAKRAPWKSNPWVWVIEFKVSR
jgi:hypothetical protein